MVSTATILSGCGSSDDKKEADPAKEPKTDYKVSMVTDVGGVDDKSFNQSAWEGVQAYGKENNLEKTVGYDYAASKKDDEYVPNLTKLAKADFDLVFGVGFLMEKAVAQAADENPDTDFAIVDAVVDKPNVASITFAEEEGSFLCGVAAAMTTKTKKVGFVGGTDTPIINKFEAGFTAGVHAVDPTIEVVSNYTGAFDKAELGKAAASAMYKSGVDVIFQAAGATGKGVFSEAVSLKEADPSRDVWVIGVDKDQYEDGLLKDGETSVTLTSMMKRVDVAVQDVANKGKEGDFPGGETLVYDLESGGVGLSESDQNLTPEIKTAVDDYTQKIISGEIVVPTEVVK